MRSRSAFVGTLFAALMPCLLATGCVPGAAEEAGAGGAPGGGGGAGGKGVGEGGAGAGAGGAGGSGGSTPAGGGTAAVGGSPATGGMTAPGAGGNAGDAGTGGSSGSSLPDAAAGPPSGPGKIVLVGSDLPSTFGVAVDPITGDIYSADYGDNRIRKVGKDGNHTIVLGPGAPGAAGQVTMRRPHDLLFQPRTRNLFVGDTMGSRVLRLKVDSGEVTVIAGTGGKVPSGGNTFCLAFDPAGDTLYFTGGGGIRVVDLKTETLKTTLPYGNPRVITMDSKGTLYAVKNGGNALQVVDAEGRASNVPGGSPVDAPKRITTDNQDNVIIVDTESHSILKYDITTKSITRLVGNGTRGTGTLGGSPLQAQTARPHGAFVDPTNRILIADSFNNRIIAIEYQ